MPRITTRLSLGATAPFRLLHISDTHLCLCDERDDDRKQALAVARGRYFPRAAEFLAAAEAYARAESMPIVHTGDLIDFVSAANLDEARRFAAENDLLFTAGNHEFSLYVGEAFEDAAYRAQSLDRVQAAFGHDIRFASRVINGINLVAIDDGYYRFDAPQLDALRREVERGLPIVLFLHNPLYEAALFADCRPRGDSAYLVATPPALMSDYSDYRRRQQEADAVTVEAVRFIEACPAIRAIFAGHLHRDWDGIVADRLPQSVTGIGTERVIEIE